MSTIMFAKVTSAVLFFVVFISHITVGLSMCVCCVHSIFAGELLNWAGGIMTVVDVSCGSV